LTASLLVATLPATDIFPDLGLLLAEVSCQVATDDAVGLDGLGGRGRSPRSSMLIDGSYCKCEAILVHVSHQKRSVKQKREMFSVVPAGENRAAAAAVASGFSTWPEAT
jgi:hypothetical protein